jgi:N-acetylmuramoyl-L-alanine amidase
MKEYFLFFGISLSIIMACHTPQVVQQTTVPKTQTPVPPTQPKPYAETNALYQQQVQKYAERLSQTPLNDTIGLAQPPFWVGTVNFNMRRPNFVIIHHTAQTSCEQTLKTFTLQRTQVSAHYVICEDGTVHHMLDDMLRAWHAGAGRWGNITDINSISIGIELDNDGKEPFAEPQMNSLLQLLTHLKKAYSIPTANFIGHADIAPTRKDDPSVYFDWKRLADNGFGHWYSDTTDDLPADFNPSMALRLIGYDMRDTTAVQTVFKRKYLKKVDFRPLTESDKKVLWQVARKFW